MFKATDRVQSKFFRNDGNLELKLIQESEVINHSAFADDLASNGEDNEDRSFIRPSYLYTIRMIKSYVIFVCFYHCTHMSKNKFNKFNYKTKMKVNYIITMYRDD